MTDKLSPIQQELLNRADGIFASISTAVGQAKDIAVEQLPDIAYQYIAFNRAYLTFIVVLAVAIFVSFQFFYIKFANKSCLTNRYDKGKWDFDQGAPYVIGTFISCLFCGGAFLTNIKELFLVWFAPKVFLLEHIVTLIKH